MVGRPLEFHPRTGRMVIGAPYLHEDLRTSLGAVNKHSRVLKTNPLREIENANDALSKLNAREEHEKADALDGSLPFTVTGALAGLFAPIVLPIIGGPFVGAIIGLSAGSAAGAAGDIVIENRVIRRIKAKFDAKKAQVRLLKDGFSAVAMHGNSLYNTLAGHLNEGRIVNDSVNTELTGQISQALNSGTHIALLRFDRPEVHLLPVAAVESVLKRTPDKGWNVSGLKIGNNSFAIPVNAALMKDLVKPPAVLVKQK